MVELVRSGRTPEALAREFEPSAQAIRNWVAQAGRDAGERTDGLRTGEREEMRRLRRENRRLREEREILAKATAWFARETGSGGLPVPDRESGPFPDRHHGPGARCLPETDRHLELSSAIAPGTAVDTAGAALWEALEANRRAAP